eukprot:9026373-Pyramimonas_sp.AAC.1
MGCMLRCAGDWQWLKQGLGLQGWGDGASMRCCWQCEATLHHLGDAGVGASWRSRYITTAQFLNWRFASGIQISGIFNLPGFLLEYVTADWMHTVDLGIAQ